MPDGDEANPINPYASPQSVEPSAKDPLQLANASRAARLRAAMIDMGMYMMAAACGSAVSFLTADLNLGDLEGEHVTVAWNVVMTIAAAVTLLGVVNWTLVAFEGQTLGKKASRVRIVRIEDNGPPGLFRGVLLRSWLPLLFSSIPRFGPLFLLLDSVTIFGPDSRCLHDYFARTRVIAVRKRKSS